MDYVGDPDTAGIPDVMLVKGPWLIYAELKSRNKWPTDEQWTALYELLDASRRRNPHVEVYLLHSHGARKTSSSSRTYSAAARRMRGGRNSNRLTLLAHPVLNSQH